MSLRTVAAPAGVPAEPNPEGRPEQTSAVRARTSRHLVTRGFLRHRGATAGLAGFGGILVLAFSSIGVAGLPGWWDIGYEQTGTVVDAGRMSLDLLPVLADGDGLAVGRHPFGQDDVGRDYFALTMRGTQRSILIALLVGMISTALGVLVGGTAGYFRGRIDAVLMRLTDLVLTLPLLVIAAVLARTVTGAGIGWLAVVIGLLTWTTPARLVRGEFLALRETDFVQAARAMGAPDARIIVRHILPNVLGTVTVSATLAVSAAILLETSLSYLGLGVTSPDTSLGLLISQYESSFATRPWLFWWPGIFIVSIALAVNFVGDGLRDAFDPRRNGAGR